MYDPAGRVVYVGQSKDLKARVSSYKYVQPGRSSRKMVRLVHTVASITVQTCESAAHAQVREYQLLQLHRPKFNTANSYPPSYLFIGVQLDPTELRLRAGPEVTEELRFGAFKSWARFAYAALVRSLWTMLHQPRSLDRFPLGMLASKRVAAMSFAHETIQTRCDAGTLFAMLHSYLGGQTNELVNFLETNFPPLGALSLTQQSLHTQDLAVLRDFFARGPQRNRTLADRFALNTAVIPECELDELVLQAKVTSSILP